MIIMITTVIVVGAGPSGSVIAKLLAEKGIQIIVLEKRMIPYTEQNEKVCAGVLNPNGIEALDGVPPEIIERQIRVAEWISNKGYRGNFPFQNKRSVNAVTVARRNLDNHLVNLAQSHGANIIPKEKVKKIQFASDFIKVSTQTNEYSAQFIIGSGGFSCPVGRFLSLKRNQKFRKRDNSIIAGQYIVKVHKDILEENFSDKIHVFLDYSLAPFGYFYLIPHKETLCIGTGYLIKNQGKNERITDYLEKGLNHPKVSSLLGDDYQILTKRIGFVAYQKSFPKQSDIIGNNWCLIGESANLVTPFVGSGITPGILSAKILAENLTSYFETEDRTFLNNYYEKLKNELKNRFSSENALSRLLTSNKRMDNFVKFISNHPQYLEKAIVDQKKLNLIEKLKIYFHTVF